MIARLQADNVRLGEYINADDIAATLVGSYEDRVRAAQAEAGRRREACLRERRDFAFETVMSHPSKVELLERASAEGWFVILYFVATDNPAINVSRVAGRVQRGGHDVPESRIRERYRRTLALLPRALDAAETAALFDNSVIGEDAGLRLVLTKSGASITRVGPSPDWLTRVLA